jgi:hypothetical protein
MESTVLSIRKAMLVLILIQTIGTLIGHKPRGKENILLELLMILIERA